MSSISIVRIFSSSFKLNPLKTSKVFTQHTPSLTQIFRATYATQSKDDSSKSAATTSSTKKTGEKKRLRYKAKGAPSFFGEETSIDDEYKGFETLFKNQNFGGADMSAAFANLEKTVPDIKKQVDELMKQQEVDFSKLQTINKQDLEKIIAGKGNYCLIDVRDPKEIEITGKIPTAINVPVSEIVGFEDSNWADLNKFDEIIFYCKSGRRSKLASELAMSAGLKSVKNYKGSADDWFGTADLPIPPLAKQVIDEVRESMKKYDEKPRPAPTDLKEKEEKKEKKRNE
eukprot:TRINITY_DN1912_c0_g1_i1.p1 TRINITY_DN1912_c0_g1~~TRINITY_DN1912_c0_g1_i1.p1  ORF type:complete len:309 (-),score=84.38 TRINITY_DN1912_c0_g1_i1:112-969(-)